MRKRVARSDWPLARLARASGFALALAIVPASLGLAAPRGADPDWPCQQRLVPTLSAGLFWNGPDLPANRDWRREKNVADLVEKISPRNVTAEQGQAMIKRFVDGLGDNRREMLTLAFAGLLEETNRQRMEIIGQLKSLGRRQRNLAAAASAMGDELGKIPPDAAGDAAARRADLERRRMYTIKAFETGQQTVRYACEAPIELEGRLGSYARALQAALS